MAHDDLGRSAGGPRLDAARHRRGLRQRQLEERLRRRGIEHARRLAQERRSLRQHEQFVGSGWQCGQRKRAVDARDRSRLKPVSRREAHTRLDDEITLRVANATAHAHAARNEQLTFDGLVRTQHDAFDERRAALGQHAQRMRPLRNGAHLESAIGPRERQGTGRWLDDRRQRLAFFELQQRNHERSHRHTPDRVDDATAHDGLATQHDATRAPRSRVRGFVVHEESLGLDDEAKFALGHSRERERPCSIGLNLLHFAARERYSAALRFGNGRIAAIDDETVKAFAIRRTHTGVGARNVGHRRCRIRLRSRWERWRCRSVVATTRGGPRPGERCERNRRDERDQQRGARSALSAWRHHTVTAASGPC